jgi:hypothetical protein
VLQHRLQHGTPDQRELAAAAATALEGSSLQRQRHDDPAIIQFSGPATVGNRPGSLLLGFSQGRDGLQLLGVKFAPLGASAPTKDMIMPRSSSGHSASRPQPHPSFASTSRLPPQPPRQNPADDDDPGMQHAMFASMSDARDHPQNAAATAGAEPSSEVDPGLAASSNGAHGVAARVPTRPKARGAVNEAQSSGTFHGGMLVGRSSPSGLILQEPRKSKNLKPKSQAHISLLNSLPNSVDDNYRRLITRFLGYLEEERLSWSQLVGNNSRMRPTELEQAVIDAQKAGFSDVLRAAINKAFNFKLLSATGRQKLPLANDEHIALLDRVGGSVNKTYKSHIKRFLYRLEEQGRMWSQLVPDESVVRPPALDQEITAGISDESLRGGTRLALNLAFGFQLQEPHSALDNSQSQSQSQSQSRTIDSAPAQAVARTVAAQSNQPADAAPAHSAMSQSEDVDQMAGPADANPVVALESWVQVAARTWNAGDRFSVLMGERRVEFEMMDHHQGGNELLARHIKPVPRPQ